MRSTEISAGMSDVEEGQAVTGTVELQGLRKEYDDIVAVDGVDLEVASGEFLTLLGPSGCGKSTTLRMISGLETPTEGDVFISGERATAQPANKRNTSMVFQEWALFPHMTVEENIGFGLRMDGVPKDERKGRITEALELVELPGFHDRNATELSGGQKQRVAMARSIVREPDVLLLDEPLASLDRRLRQHMQVELKAIQEDLGITFLYVTHDQEEALTMSDRIAVMNEGQIEQVGETTELYERPTSKFVASFLGETNLFEGELRRENGRFLVETGELTVETTDDGNDIDFDGNDVALTIRPERVMLARSTRTLDATNAWEGTVVEAVYKGSLKQYNIDIGGVNVHVEKQINDETEVFDVGDRVVVGFPRTAVRLVHS